jgi:Ca-activated chloride channel family protein
MRLAYPVVLLFLPVLAGLYAWTRRSLERRRSCLVCPAVPEIRRLGAGRRARLARLLPPLRFVAVGLGVVALARPQFGERKEKLLGEGIDIMLAMDVSESMRAEDFKPLNRLHVARERAQEFVRGRSGDRIGLVIFGGDAYTKCPLTADYAALANLISGVSFDDVSDPNATAIGMAIATAANRLKDSRAKSRVIILLTDGINNTGSVDPRTAAELCRSLGVRVYTVGVGSESARVPYPETDPLGGTHYVYVESRLDEETLTEVAETSGGRYFRATDPDALRQIYERIGELEKSDVETQLYVRYSEVGPALALLALLLLVSELILSETVFRRLIE